jgi:hypothetical protein
MTTLLSIKINLPRGHSMGSSILYTAISALIILTTVLFITVRLLKSNKEKFEKKKAKIDAKAKELNPGDGEAGKERVRQFIPSDQR